MKCKSIRYELDGKEFNDESCGADITLETDGTIHGHLYCRGADVNLNKMSPNDLDFLATMVVFLVERISEEKIKLL